MRTTVLFAILSLTINPATAQEFEYNIEGLTDYVVVETSAIGQAEMYLKAKNWVKDTFFDPAEVLKADFLDDKIRIEGVTPDAFCGKIMGMTSCSDAKYQIEISFKDGKYKFDPIELSFPSTSTQYGYMANVIPLKDGSNYYKKSGKVRNKYSENIIASFELVFNSLNTSLKNYLSSEPKAKEDW